MCWLIFSTFLLTILGTLLTRSGLSEFGARILRRARLGTGSMDSFW